MPVCRSVLVVDDDESYRALLRNYLERLGCEVQEADDGAKAEKIVTKQHIALMVLDIVMPNVEGLETIQRVRSEGVDTRILAVSGTNESLGYLKMASLLGADAVLNKTRPISELLNLIQVLLSRAGLERAVGAVADTN